MNVFDELKVRIETFLQAEESFIVSEEFRRSTRGVGDAIEGLIVDRFGDITRGLVDSVNT
jgi:23S rRNA G2069 N7-methylase RlmK/C1962 C5-methylase RlmI